MTRFRTFVASIGILALALGAITVQADDAAKDGLYTVVIKKVEVAKTQKNGSAWDVNDGKPDLMVIVRVVGEKDATFKTKEKTDTFSADFNEPTSIKFRMGQSVEFEVVDVDVAVNDTIGKKQHTLTLDGLKKDKGKCHFDRFDQVISLEVEFKKL